MENAPLIPKGDLAADTKEWPALLDDQAATGLGNRIEDDILIERFNRPLVMHSSLDSPVSNSSAGYRAILNLWY